MRSASSHRSGSLNGWRDFGREPFDVGSQQPDTVRAIAAENANLSAQLTDDAAALERESVELAELRKAKHDLDERMHRVEARAAVYALGEEFAQTLTEMLRQLTRPERFAVAREHRAELLVAASNAELRAARALAAWSVSAACRPP